MPYKPNSTLGGGVSQLFEGCVWILRGVGANRNLDPKKNRPRWLMAVEYLNNVAQEVARGRSVVMIAVGRHGGGGRESFQLRAEVGRTRPDSGAESRCVRNLARAGSGILQTRELRLKLLGGGLGTARALERYLELPVPESLDT